MGAHMIETAQPQTETDAPTRKRRFGAKLILPLVVIILLAASVLTVLNIGGGLSAGALKKTWTVISGGAGDASFSFVDGFDSVFADLGSAVVASGSSGVAVYGSGGSETARDALAARNPAIASASGMAVAYDIGGRSLRVVDETGIIASLTFESNIVSCSVSEDSGFLSGGRLFAVCTEGADGYKGQVSLYKMGKSGPELIYSWFSGEGYVLETQIAPGNKEFAVLTITPRGGRIVLLSREQKDIIGEYIYDGAAIIEIDYLQSGALIARTADGLIKIDADGTGSEIYGFEGGAPSGYCAGGSFLAIYFEQAANEASSGILVIVDERGSELGRIKTSRSLVWLSADGDRIAVLWSDGLDIYDRSLRLAVSYPEASGAVRGYARGASRAVVFGNREGKAFSGRTE